RDAPEITRALTEVLGDDRYRRRAAEVALEMAHAPPVRDVVERLLDGGRRATVDGPPDVGQTD
ncbi:MAG: hypothetical protein JO368_10995, partial [Acidimicrobiales bacterium]|nr:hypothetical protein [Acidimicrobiales bacterium]